MTSVNRLHQSGHARAFIVHEPHTDSNRMFVMHEGFVVQLQGDCMTMSRAEEGTMATPDEAFCSWSGAVEDQVVDVFKAIAKALELYSDEPSQAFRQGYAEGESKVLREWNESLRGLD